MDFHGPSHTYRYPIFLLFYFWKDNFISISFYCSLPCLDCRMFVDILKYLLLNFVVGFGLHRKG